MDKSCWLTVWLSKIAGRLPQAIAQGAETAVIGAGQEGDARRGLEAGIAAGVTAPILGMAAGRAEQALGARALQRQLRQSDVAVDAIDDAAREGRRAMNMLWDGNHQTRAAYTEVLDDLLRAQAEARNQNTNLAMTLMASAGEGYGPELLRSSLVPQAVGAGAGALTALRDELLTELKTRR